MSMSAVVGRGIAVGARQQPIGRSKGYSGGTVEECSWDFIENGDPVVTAATASKRYESDLIQWE